MTDAEDAPQFVRWGDNAFPYTKRADGLLVDLTNYEGRFPPDWARLLVERGVPAVIVERAKESQPAGYALVGGLR